jgi:invasion protein IalB
MKLLYHVFAVLVCLTLLNSAHAQDATKPVPTEKGKLSKFGNWIVLCPPDSDTTGARCAAQFSLIDKKRKLAVIVWRIGFNKQKKLAMDMVTPTEVFITKGVRVAIGKNPAITLPYVSCGLRGCQSSLIVTPELMASIKGATSAILILAPTNGKSLQLKLDITGLNGAVAALLGQ